jgi:hypothetical protein
MTEGVQLPTVAEHMGASEEYVKKTLDRLVNGESLTVPAERKKVGPSWSFPGYISPVGGR